MYCQNCGQPIEEGSDVCKNCNTPVQMPAKKLKTGELPAHKLAWIAFFIWIGSDVLLSLASFIAIASQTSGNYTIFSIIFMIAASIPMLTLSIISVINSKKQTYEKTAKALFIVMLVLASAYVFTTFMSLLALGL